MSETTTTIEQLEQYRRQHEQNAEQILAAEVRYLRKTMPGTPEGNLRAIAMNRESVRRAVLSESRKAGSLGHTIRQRTRRQQELNTRRTA